MQIRTEQDPATGNFSIVFEGNDVELRMLARMVEREVVQQIADAIVKRAIEARGDEIIAALPIPEIARLAVDRVALRIAEEKSTARIEVRS